MTPPPLRPRTVVAAFAALALTATACSDDEAEPAANVGDLGVVDVRELDLPFGDAFLAPNGERIATYAEDELCIFSAEGEQERCVQQETALDPNSIRWNPEGTRLLFTENFFERLEDPDIWVLDAESGDVANLTDDGTDGSVRDVVASSDEDEPAADIDAVPVWVDDSTVRFLRWHHSGDERSVEVMEVPADGGEPEPVGTLATEVLPVSVAYTADGRAAYVREDHEDVALSGLDGESAETLTDDTTVMVTASDSGEDLLVMPNPAAAGHMATWPAAEVVPLDGGEPTEVADSVQWVSWRSGGEGLVYAGADTDDPESATLYVVAGTEHESREIATGAYLAPYRAARWRSPVWSERDTILLMERRETADADEGAPFRYVLLQLGTG